MTNKSALSNLLQNYLYDWLNSQLDSFVKEWNLKSNFRFTDPKDRVIFEECIEKALVSNKGLLSYLKILVKVVSDGKALPDIRTDKKSGLEKRVQAHGIKVLSDLELVTLATDPMMIIGIATSLEQKQSMYWVDVLERENIPIFGKKRKHTVLKG